VKKEHRGEHGLRKVWHVTSYAVGFALDGGVGQVLTAYWMPFLMFAMGLDPLLAGLAAGLSKIWDGVIDPLIGLLVDSTKTKWGKCRPWLLASVAPVFVTYVLLWTNLGIQGQWGKFFYFIFA
jgi:Na+/melibiose symporter-like transporter